MTGVLSKVVILAFKDKGYQQKVGEFTLPINPEQLSRSFKVQHDEQQAKGAKGNDPKFISQSPEDLKFDFTFDGTGVIPVSNQATKSSQTRSFYKDVIGQINNFLELVYVMNGETHKPNFLRLLWGGLFGNDNVFNCVLKDLQINYTLFAPDGKPLRAKISVGFVGFIEQKLRIREEGKKSPDVTHLRKVKAGDMLPLMTYEIYGDPSYYLQVAKVNGLVNFRRLATNADLRFPPIERTGL